MKQLIALLLIMVMSFELIIGCDILNTGEDSMPQDTVSQSSFQSDLPFTTGAGAK
jgi:hypothetical protein